jgi:hypothetical protein
VSQPSPDPISLERARLLLGWLRAQRAVDNCLSELLAAGPAGERRVSGHIDRVSELVAGAAAAFEAYRASIDTTGDPAAVRPLDGPSAAVANPRDAGRGAVTPISH